MDIKEIRKAWKVLEDYLSIPSCDEDLDKLIAFSHKLIDIGDDQDDSLLNLVGDLIYHYEKEYLDLKPTDPIDTIKYLMEEHSLKQKDLVEIGSPGVVSEVLNGKRQLNVRQIKALSERFGVGPEVFMS